MYKLLIVDDEPDVVEGLYNAFYNYEDLELDIFKAFSAYEALEILNTERVDIVLSDINMPGMNGLEMVRQVKARWPHSQVIFLSGYTEFDYIYQANQLEAVNYILKTEGYEKIAESLHKAVQRIRNQVRLSRLSESPLEFRHEFLVSLLEYPDIGPEEPEYMIRNMNLSLDHRQAVCLMIGSITNAEDFSLREQSAVYPILQQLTYTYLLPRFEMILDEYRKNTFVFVLQPRPMDSVHEADESQPHPVKRIKGIAEVMQDRFSEEAGINLSFVIWGKPVRLHCLGEAYKSCNRLILNSRTRGAGLIIARTGMFVAPGGADGGKSNIALGDSQAIHMVREHISENLNKPLSLTALADLVHYNASYLSRIFKAATGMTLTSYITSMRIQRAQELLAQTNRKINSIAAELCFASPSYFNQTFRKYMGMSPLEYRARYGSSAES